MLRGEAGAHSRYKGITLTALFSIISSCIQKIKAKIKAIFVKSLLALSFLKG